MISGMIQPQDEDFQLSRGIVRAVAGLVHVTIVRKYESRLGGTFFIVTNVPIGAANCGILYWISLKFGVVFGSLCRLVVKSL